MKIKFTTILVIISLIIPTLFLLLFIKDIELNSIELLGLHFEVSNDFLRKERIQPPDELNLPTNISEESDINKSNEKCWKTIWQFSPENYEDISNQLQPSRSSYYQVDFDFSDTPNSNIPGAIKIYTNKKIEAELIDDPNSWSWICNYDLIPIENAEYRLLGWMKTENTKESHISIVARNSISQGIFMNNTNQMVKIPYGTRNGSSSWTEYTSTKFNPFQWSENSQVIVIGLNAGPSLDGERATTWFTDIRLQQCKP